VRPHQPRGRRRRRQRVAPCHAPRCTCAPLQRWLRRYVARPMATGPLCTTMAVATPTLMRGEAARLAAPTARPSDTAARRERGRGERRCACVE
jgi:hypothetical protein